MFASRLFADVIRQAGRQAEGRKESAGGGGRREEIFHPADARAPLKPWLFRFSGGIFWTFFHSSCSLSGNFASVFATALVRFTRQTAAGKRVLFSPPPPPPPLVVVIEERAGQGSLKEWRLSQRSMFFARKFSGLPLPSKFTPPRPKIVAGIFYLSVRFFYAISGNR